MKGHKVLDELAKKREREASEREANEFALALLMPKDLVRKEVLRHPIDITNEAHIKTLALKFQVSPAIMAFRLGQIFS